MDFKHKLMMDKSRGVTFGPNTKPPRIARLAVGIPYCIEAERLSIDSYCPSLQPYVKFSTTVVKYCVQLNHDDQFLELFRTLHDFELLHQRIHFDCARVKAALPAFPGPVLDPFSSRYDKYFVAIKAVLCHWILNWT